VVFTDRSVIVMHGSPGKIIVKSHQQHTRDFLVQGFSSSERRAEHVR
jgi:hypothetical protein